MDNGNCIQKPYCMTMSQPMFDLLFWTIKERKSWMCIMLYCYIVCQEHTLHTCQYNTSDVKGSGFVLKCFNQRYGVHKKTLSKWLCFV